jgi:hypothetical protein
MFVVGILEWKQNHPIARTNLLHHTVQIMDMHSIFKSRGTLWEGRQIGRRKYRLFTEVCRIYEFFRLTPTYQLIWNGPAD